MPEEKQIIEHKNSIKGDIEGVALIIAATILFIFCYGNPDLLDALIHHFMK